jgi:hypothetical protein
MSLFISDSSHPLADRNNRIPITRYALYAKIGPGPHACTHCGTQVNWTKGQYGSGIVAFHIDGDRTNLSQDNLAPECLSCMRRRTSYNRIREDETVFVNRNGRRERGEHRNCKLCGKQFVVSLANLRTNPRAGQYCSGSCRSSARNGVKSKIQP